jgi:hypothetical protein
MVYNLMGAALLFFSAVGITMFFKFFLPRIKEKKPGWKYRPGISSFFTVTGGALITFGLLLHGLPGAARMCQIGAVTYVVGFTIFLMNRKRRVS